MKTAHALELTRVFASAVSFVDYLAAVPCHAMLWHARLRGLTREQIQASVAGAPIVSQPVSVLAFAEPWCIDAVMNVPLLHRLSEVEPRLSVRIAPLSQHPVAHLFPGRGGRPRVPTIVFFRGCSAETEYWSERSRRTHAWFERFVREYPMPPLCVVDNRPGTPELEAWMALRFERESAAEHGELWRAAIAEWRESIGRLCENPDPMLQLRPSCECCGRDLPPDSADARICTFECIFCADCADGVLGGVCPNCGGDFVRRPLRPPALLIRYPLSNERVVKPHGGRLRPADLLQGCQLCVCEPLS